MLERLFDERENQISLPNNSTENSSISEKKNLLAEEVYQKEISARLFCLSNVESAPSTHNDGKIKKKRKDVPYHL